MRSKSILHGARVALWRFRKWRWQSRRNHRKHRKFYYWEEKKAHELSADQRRADALIHAFLMLRG